MSFYEVSMSPISNAVLFYISVSGAEPLAFQRVHVLSLDATISVCNLTESYRVLQRLTESYGAGRWESCGMFFLSVAVTMEKFPNSTSG